MHKIQELFDVELGEKFDIESLDYGRINDCCFAGSWILKLPSTRNIEEIVILTELINGEARIIKHKKPILTEKEKEYLKSVIKPFEEKYIFIKKAYDELNNEYYIRIDLEHLDLGHIDLAHRKHINLPRFPIDSEMYEGMKANEWYTLYDLEI